MMPHTKLATTLFVFITFLLPTTLWANVDFETEIASRIKARGDSGYYTVEQQTLYGSHFITSLYRANGNQPVWNKESIKTLLVEIQKLENDGLNPKDYWMDSMTVFINTKNIDTKSAVDLDMLLSEAFLRAYYNLHIGKVDPEALDKSFNFPKELDRKKLLPVIIKQINNGEISETFDNARSKDNLYINLTKALIQYREYKAAGGWPLIAKGKTLKPGQENARITQVRERLTITGDYQGSTAEPALFDSTLETAIKQFQRRHGLDIDGLVGPGTLAAMNIPVEQKINQLRVNLERQRWYSDEIQGEYIVADIAGFRVFWVKDNEVIWETRSQVGKSYTQTPMFRSDINTIEFNPTWTIPPTIMRKTILPGLKKDPDYLGKKGFLLLTFQGEEVDPKTVDWSSITTMPYMVRQPAGPNNALGMVKFLFPNKHYVYLHDTNHRWHFNQARRSFSAGCVRIDKPFDFAEQLLAGQDGWDRKKIDDVIASGKTTRVSLKKPIRIVLAYNTASPRADGVYFKEDIYKRDNKVLEELNEKFKLRATDQPIN
jgi:murein L,D-transpeptidase YcbB/YkuD